MRTLNRSKKCFKILLTANLVLLILVGSVLVFSVDSINQEENSLKIISNTPAQQQNCGDICPKSYSIAKGSECCIPGNTETCEEKQTCKENRVSEMKDDIKDKYQWFYILFGVLGFLLLTLSAFVCVNKILLKRQRRLQM